MHQTASVPTPEADVSVPPPPQQEEAGEQPLEQADAQPREPWTTRQLALGCLGAFFVVFVLGAFVAALAGNGGGNEAQKNKKGGGWKDTASKPVLVVSSPSGSPTVTSDSIEVEGEVMPATSKVTVNGEEVTPADDGSISTPFHLNVGENYIQITAEKGSEQADASRTVTREPAEKEIAAQEAPQVQKNEQQPQAEKKPRPQAEYSVGQTAQVANVQWRVSDAYLTNQLRSNFGTQKRGRFVVVNFTFTNNRDEEVTLDPEFKHPGKLLEVALLPGLLALALGLLTLPALSRKIALRVGLKPLVGQSVVEHHLPPDRSISCSISLNSASARLRRSSCSSSIGGLPKWRTPTSLR